MAIQKGEVFAYAESIPNLKDLKDRDHATPSGVSNRPWNFVHVPFTTHSLLTPSPNDTHSLSPTRTHSLARSPTHTLMHSLSFIHSLQRPQAAKDAGQVVTTGGDLIHSHSKLDLAITPTPTLTRSSNHFQ